MRPNISYVHGATDFVTPNRRFLLDALRSQMFIEPYEYLGHCRTRVDARGERKE